MLRSANQLIGYKLAALDGEIGKVHDLYFDDSSWTLRYLVANTGNWLSGRRVLISPIPLGPSDEKDRQINVDLTIDRIRNSPDIDTAKPVSKQQEIDFHSYYGWPYYGFGTGFWGLRPYPWGEPVEPESESEEDENRDFHLRSVKEVTGYGIEATDEEIGHVEDFVIDDENWQIKYMVVDTKALWLGKKILVSPKWVERVNWSERAVAVALDQDEIKRAPEWDGNLPVDASYDEKLQEHYRVLSYLI